MPLVFFECEPYDKSEAIRAIEAGVDGLLVPDADLEAASGLARTLVLPQSLFMSLRLEDKAGENEAAQALSVGRSVLLRRPWQVIPVENLLSLPAGHGADGERAILMLEAGSLEEALLAAEILERGADAVLIRPEAASELAAIVRVLNYAQDAVELVSARILEISPAGLGHRVCIDTTSLMQSGQGMLVGNSAALTFLVHAETEHNEYVSARPFRVNAGAVHAYVLQGGDRTCYLSELKAGSELLVVDAAGRSHRVTAGRVKTEQRPMLLLRAFIPSPEEGGPPGAPEGGQEGSVFLQNAETVHVVGPDGKARSVVDLKPGDEVLCRLDKAGRHFGARIEEDIQEL